MLNALIGALSSWPLTAHVWTWLRSRWWVGLPVGGALVAGTVFFLAVDSTGCSSRDEVTARVASLSADLQQAAANGKMTVETMASNIRRMNEAAIAYGADEDHQAYCNALDKQRDELELDK